MDGSYEVCVQIAEAFFVECPGLLSALRVAIQNKNAPELASSAHALKGTIANFTDGPAFQSAARLEELAREADLHRAGETFRRLEADVDALLRSLRSFASAVAKS
jgi:HPt (histidine-containing phosphotransfer) domain-containing protein